MNTLVHWQDQIKTLESLILQAAEIALKLDIEIDRLKKEEPDTHSILKLMADSMQKRVDAGLEFISKDHTP